MNLSKNNLALIEVCQKGYEVINGEILNHLNKKINFILTKKGYPIISVSIWNTRYPVKVHRLVAYQKFGNAVFEKGIEVRHLNGNKLDFSFENILIGTAKENSQDKPKEKRLKCASYARAFMKRRISFNLACKIREDLNNLDYKHGDYAKIAKKYQISSEIVRGIKRGRYSKPF